MDFRFVNISSDPNNPKYISIPDPDRYEFINKRGKVGWIDKLDERRLFFPIRVVRDMLRRAAEMPLGDLRPLIQSSDAYILSRVNAIREGLRIGVWDDDFRNAADEELNAGEATRTRFVIASIDLVGSTVLSQNMEPLQYARLIQTYSRELARLSALFHGRTLKFMGDGAILYFPTGSNMRKHDLAIDCALSLRDLVLNGINPVLEESGHPILACRIGVDSGDAYIMTIGDSATTNHLDIIGQVVNIATKVEKAAPVNGICFGESVALITHTMWLKYVRRWQAPSGWPYRNIAGDSAYGVFLLDIPAP
jgi:class 3 adenylate cyclase